jgi:hypothetical protein
MKKLIFTMFFVFQVILGMTMVGTVVAQPPEGADPNEPKITIKHGKDKTFYEYRVNGLLKEIKVVPSVGPEYYLVSADGGGWIREEKSQLLVPSWVIFRW